MKLWWIFGCFFVWVLLPVVVVYCHCDWRRAYVEHALQRSTSIRTNCISSRVSTQNRRICNDNVPKARKERTPEKKLSTQSELCAHVTFSGKKCSDVLATGRTERFHCKHSLSHTRLWLQFVFESLPRKWFQKMLRPDEAQLNWHQRTVCFFFVSTCEVRRARKHTCGLEPLQMQLALNPVEASLPIHLTVYFLVLKRLMQMLNGRKFCIQHYQVHAAITVWKYYRNNFICPKKRENASPWSLMASDTANRCGRNRCVVI